MNYYNEFDPYCAEWLRNLIVAGEIPPGDVDERSIEDVLPNDLDGYTQCHFFAGIGGWPLALRLAGWPDDRPIWTGSCPCQPFSAAGKRGGVADERHLWPAFYWLIRQCRPRNVAGEQVASKDGRAWLAGVQADLEALGYCTAGADLCAASVGAPHIRQRLWWVADAGCDVRESDARPREVPGAPRQAESETRERQRGGACDSAGSAPCSSGLADMHRAGFNRREERDEQPAGGVESSLRHDADGRGAVRSGRSEAGRGTDANAGRLSDAERCDGQQECTGAGRRGEGSEAQILVERSGHAGAWDGAIWLPCADGKARRIEPGIEPLAYGVSGRVGLLRGYGNAIVPQVAAEVIGSFMDSEWLL